MSTRDVPIIDSQRTLGIRPSKLLVFRIQGRRCVVTNELVGISRYMPLLILTLLLSDRAFASDSDFKGALQNLFPKSEDIRSAASTLLESGIYVLIDSELDKLETKFSEWVWGASTGSHFLATRRVTWLSEELEVEQFGKLLADGDIPQLWETINEDAEWKPLGVSMHARNAFHLFAQRRSLRQFSKRSVELDLMGAVLSAGFGIHDFLSLPYRPTYPLKFAPSPGGLNCYSAMLLVHNVQGLKRGVYRYNAHLNQVKLLGDLPQPSISPLLGNQSWADEAPVIVLLSVDYKKMAWKYRSGSAFNSLLIEAGHIAQNMLICASSLGMGAVPTNAIDEKRLGDHFGLDFPRQALIYAVALGFPDQNRSRDHYSKDARSRLQAIIESA